MFPKGFEWVVILIVALLIFGPKNLPKLGKSLGKTVKNIREGMSVTTSSRPRRPRSSRRTTRSPSSRPSLPRPRPRRKPRPPRTPSNPRTQGLIAAG
ncbi:MAG: twin-arginine translocase TatA/TatE family subunit [Collinsella sp.]